MLISWVALVRTSFTTVAVRKDLLAVGGAAGFLAGIHNRKVYSKHQESMIDVAITFHIKFSKVSAKNLINSISLWKLSDIISLDHENEISDVQSSMH